MLQPELFSAVTHLPRQSDNLEQLPADLTDNFNNMLLSGFQLLLRNLTGTQNTRNSSMNER